ncbi:uncharacterized protein LOC134531285 [Bacillus rossius redtenbacheri]|uniref:uncharacterized protein LOC134531285 n=1 Tax=Bacillus rossius redtenbacheri TaxID=93214 RepID=UPI002FDCC934
MTIYVIKMSRRIPSMGISSVEKTKEDKSKHRKRSTNISNVEVNSDVSADTYIKSTFWTVNCTEKMDRSVFPGTKRKKKNIKMNEDCTGGFSFDKRSYFSFTPEVFKHRSDETATRSYVSPCNREANDTNLTKEECEGEEYDIKKFITEKVLDEVGTEGNRAAAKETVDYTRKCTGLSEHSIDDTNVTMNNDCQDIFNEIAGRISSYKKDTHEVNMKMSHSNSCGSKHRIVRDEEDFRKDVSRYLDEKDCKEAGSINNFIVNPETSTDTTEVVEKDNDVRDIVNFIEPQVTSFRNYLQYETRKDLQYNGAATDNSFMVSEGILKENKIDSGENCLRLYEVDHSDDVNYNEAFSRKEEILIRETNKNVIKDLAIDVNDKKLVHVIGEQVRFKSTYIEEFAWKKSYSKDPEIYHDKTLGDDDVINRDKTSDEDDIRDPHKTSGEDIVKDRDKISDENNVNVCDTTSGEDDIRDPDKPSGEDDIRDHHKTSGEDILKDPCQISGEDGARDRDTKLSEDCVRDNEIDILEGSDFDELVCGKEKILSHETKSIKSESETVSEAENMMEKNTIHKEEDIASTERLSDDAPVTGVEQISCEADNGHAEDQDVCLVPVPPAARTCAMCGRAEAAGELRRACRCRDALAHPRRLQLQLADTPGHSGRRCSRLGGAQHAPVTQVILMVQLTALILCEVLLAQDAVQLSLRELDDARGLEHWRCAHADQADLVRQVFARQWELLDCRWRDALRSWPGLLDFGLVAPGEDQGGAAAASCPGEAASWLPLASTTGLPEWFWALAGGAFCAQVLLLVCLAVASACSFRRWCRGQPPDAVLQDTEDTA